MLSVATKFNHWLPWFFSTHRRRSCEVVAQFLALTPSRLCGGVTFHTFFHASRFVCRLRNGPCTWCWRHHCIHAASSRAVQWRSSTRYVSLQFESIISLSLSAASFVDEVVYPAVFLSFLSTSWKETFQPWTTSWAQDVFRCDKSQGLKWSLHHDNR